MSNTGTPSIVLSMGRGRQDGSGQAYPPFARRVSGVPFIYARFMHLPVVTHFISAASLASLLLRLRRRGNLTLVAYNRLWHYIPALLVARVCRVRCFLDLEDGFALLKRGRLALLADRCVGWLFDHLCSAGVLLANSALSTQVTIARRMIWYGMLPELRVRSNWSRMPVTVLFGGTLHEERGCRLFMDAVRRLMESDPRRQIRFCVTGHGPMETELAAFADKTDGWVTFLGLMDRRAYLDILGHSHVGLMLNLSRHEMSGTTFPSKVLEYAAAGMLVISTPVSDVAAVLGTDGVILLDEETPACLAAALVRICSSLHTAQETANRGRTRVLAACDPARVAIRIAQFLELAH